MHDVATALDYTRPYYDVEWVWDRQSVLDPAGATDHGAQPAELSGTGEPTDAGRAGDSRDVVPDPFPALDWSLSGPLIKHMLTRTATLAGYPLLPSLPKDRPASAGSTLKHRRFCSGRRLRRVQCGTTKSYNRLIGGHQSDIRVPPRKLGQRLLRAWRSARGSC